MRLRPALALALALSGAMRAEVTAPFAVPDAELNDPPTRARLHEIEAAAAASDWLSVALPDPGRRVRRLWEGKAGRGRRLVPRLPMDRALLRARGPLPGGLGRRHAGQPARLSGDRRRLRPGQPPDRQLPLRGDAGLAALQPGLRRRVLQLGPPGGQAPGRLRHPRGPAPARSREIPEVPVARPRDRRRLRRPAAALVAPFPGGRGRAGAAAAQRRPSLSTGSPARTASAAPTTG